MLEILAILVIGWILWGFIKLTWAATWGIFKLLGILLSVIAFPIMFIGVLAVGIGAYLILPLVLLGAAFGCIFKC